MNGANTDGEVAAFDSLNAIDQWILTRLDETVESVDQLLEQFEFAKACEIIYHFAWDDLCDWYLELSKATFASGGDKAEASKRVLGQVLDQLLRLMHPMMPFITEELWCSFTGGETLVTANWPKANPENRSEASKLIVEQLQDLTTEIRRFRNDQGIKTSAKVGANFIGLDSLSEFEASLRQVCRIEPITGSASAAIEVGKVKIEFDLTGAIDVVAERARLTKDLATAEKDRATAKVKLENEGFMAKAPIEVVQEIRERLTQTSADIESITAQLAALPTK